MYFCPMNIEHFLSTSISPIINELFGLTTTENDIILQKTKKEFEGDYTLVTFPYIKAAKATPEKTGELIGEQLLKNKNRYLFYLRKNQNYELFEFFQNICQHV